MINNRNFFLFVIFFIILSNFIFFIQPKTFFFEISINKDKIGLYKKKIIQLERVISSQITDLSYSNIRVQNQLFYDDLKIAIFDSFYTDFFLNEENLQNVIKTEQNYIYSARILKNPHIVEPGQYYVNLYFKLKDINQNQNLEIPIVRNLINYSENLKKLKINQLKSTTRKNKFD